MARAHAGTAPSTPGPEAANRPLDSAIVQRAAGWMARLWSDEVTDADKADCAAWLAAHPDHEQAWQRLRAFDDRLGRVPAEVARQALQEPPQRATGRRRRALGLLALVGTAGGAAWLARDSEAWQLAGADLRTATGEVREAGLADGTRLVLASATGIDVAYTAAERTLFLRTGEVLVTTAHDTVIPARPFRVRMARATVQALGTRFVVRQQGRFSRVAVIEGAVAVRPADGSADAMRLEAGQQVDLDAGHAVSDPVRVRGDLTAWTRGVLVADAMRLQDLVTELARYRRGLLRCEPDVAGLRISGVFSLRDTDRALDNLTRGLPVAIVRRTDYWVTVRRRPG